MHEKYDLTDIGYKYKGIASVKSKTLKLGPWTITDVPEDIDNDKVLSFVKNFLNNIVALEIPTSLVCNLRCRYCYIDDPRMKNKKVSSEQVTELLDTCSEIFPGLSKDEETRKTVGRGKVYLSPWGAEPFMNIPTLEAMYEFGHKYYGKEKYVMSTSTNGTIWNKRAEMLFRNLIKDKAFSSIQVSLDGPKQLQDYARPTVDGKGTYDKIKEFTSHLNELAKELDIKRRLYTFCSTIHLIDDEFADNWIDAAEFFSEPGVWHTTLPTLPMRMSGEDMANDEHIKKFVDAQRRMLELVIRKAKEGITVVDFYTYKLFGNTSAHSRNAFPYCSALNSQIGVDFDGSLYPCHGPITSPEYKPFLWIGNVFDKVISYKLLFRNFSYQYGTLWTRGKCTTCPLYNFATGNVCWSCPAHNLAMTGEPSTDSILKCIAYTESFKYWIQIAKITLSNPVLDDIPSPRTCPSPDASSLWFNDLPELDYSEFTNKKLDVIDPRSHFEMEYDGMIANAVEKFDIMKRDEAGYLQFVDNWWKFDNYFNETLPKR